MIRTGLVVVLIVPAIWVMICIAVFLEQSGIMGALRRVSVQTKKLLGFLSGRNKTSGPT